MKIAVFHNLPPGGQKRALYEQVKRLAGKHEMDLFTLSSTDEGFLPLKPFIGKHYKVRYNYPGHFPWTVISILKELKGVYRKLGEKINIGDYDAAFVSPCYLTQSPYILQFLKIPSLYYCPEPKREFYEKIPRISNRLTYALTYPFRLPIKKIDMNNARSATIMLTNSYYSKRKIMEAFDLEASVNYLGVDTDLFKPIKIPKENWAVSVGSLALHKGHDFVTRSLSRIPKNIRPDFLIIGSYDPEMNYLLKLAQKLDVNLLVLNNVKDEELAEIYNRSKIYLSGALNEPFGLSLLEAIACGTPVLAVKEGGAGEIVNNDKIGRLVKRDENEFAYALEDMLHKQKMEKEDYHKRLRHNWAKEFWNWDKSVRELEKYLISLV